MPIWERVPQAAQATPPGVSDTGATGDIQRFAMENHTHASKARKQIAAGVNTATFTWTYPSPFGVGVVPICIGVAADPAASANDLYNVQIQGTPGNASCVFRINRLSSGLFGLLLGALGFNPTPGNVTLHMIALEP